MSTSNSAKRFYIGAPSAVSRINALLLTVNPPHCITRLPRAVSERAHWKASEWRHWISFYALPCLHGTLHADYWRHLAKLSEALHILLRESITFSEIDKAESLLEHFVIRCHSLYGIGSMTFHKQALLHLANCVRSLGPLWAHSAFVFEVRNGIIVRQVSSANGMPQQVVERVIMHQQLQQLIGSTHLPLMEKNFCNEIITYSLVDNAKRINDLCLLGAGKEIILESTEQHAVYLHCGVKASVAL
ncbi:hypothetical protein V5799_025355 [Amblyomma americanum]|uniref:Uncharacterized protein n=1 Tax=Amblyomma americanum TaxID=6943 RepID=A0AAQ4E9G1_AMBAM